MIPQAISDLLDREIGLDTTRLLPDVLGTAVRTRIEQTGAADLSDYISRLLSSHEELQALVEEVAVPESSFFREMTTLQALCDWAVDSANRPKRGKLKILSAACAAGEEGYSLGILLLKAGMSAADFEITGVDVRHRAVEAGRRGEYRLRSLRGKPVPEEHLIATSAETLSVTPALREVVQFEVGNILNPLLLASRRPFDIVLCRNLLIYMNPPAQKKVLGNMESLVRERGLFAVTAAEAPLLASTGFVRLSLGSTAVFTRENLQSSTVAGPAAEAPESSVPGQTDSTTGPPNPPRAQEKPPASAFSVNEVSSGSASQMYPQRPPDAAADCWNHIGVWAVERPSCPLLTELHHCVNCSFYLASGRGLLDAPAPAGYLAEWSASLMRKKEVEAADELAVTVFRLGEEWLALPTRALAEVAELGSVRTLPHVSSPLLLGVAAIRGELHLCISLSNLLNVRPSGAKTGQAKSAQDRRASPRLMVMSMNGDRWVFPADEVAATVHVQPRALMDLPVTLVKDKSAYAVGLFEWEDQRVGLLDETLLFQALRRGVSTE